METVIYKKNKIMFVCITKSFTGRPGFEVRRGRAYECTQKYWDLTFSELLKAKEADYICGTSKCIVQGIYRNTSGWKHVREFENMKNDPEIVGFSFKGNHYHGNTEYLERYAFEGEKAPIDIWNWYVGMRIPTRCKHQGRCVSFDF